MPVPTTSSGWRPISTAPKKPQPPEYGDHGGPTILLWVPEDPPVCVGFWSHIFKAWVRVNPPEGDAEFYGPPTHWMPLPGPPT